MSAQDTPATTTADSRPQPPARSGAASAIGWVLTIGLNVVAPIITYNQLSEHGWSDFSALLVSGAWPVLDSVISLAWRRKLDEFGIVALVFLVITAVVSLVGTHSPRALLIKDSGVTGLFGLLCLVTLFARRPLMFYFGRKFATDGTPASTAWWNGMWQFDGFRSTMRTMTVVWGVAYIAEALVRIGLAFVLSTSTMVIVSPIMIYGVLGGLALWTAWFSKRRAAEGARRQAAAEAAQAAAAARAEATTA
ncbi:MULTISPECIES: VC0807 family protein [Streptomyces]|uniref:VC0807 family protein n=1 Tax=Streptomyces solicathayae TaxID=3081768 RepID=A0ABZ0LZ80_9ACTN|nr:VC0807 family protein [Streptomyces sp. HUAS YS2]WOX24486.1 VC0807 family protein [Streptomyces sp. HUAS YS2]